jgi:hypothetical protein
MAVFVAASEATVEATGGTAGAGVEVGEEAGVGVDLVGPTSDLVWEIIPGPIGPDRISVTLDIPITLSPAVTIPTDLIPAIRPATARKVTTHIPMARTQAILPIRRLRPLTLEAAIRRRYATRSWLTADGTGSVRILSLWQRMCTRHLLDQARGL